MAQPRMKIMISHAYDEKDLAEMWKELLETISEHSITVWFSSDLRGNGGMTPGKDWREDLVRQLLENNLILAIQTPTSVTHDWIIWECGIAHGIHAVNAQKKHGISGIFPTKAPFQDYGIIPVVYALHRGQITSPLNTYQVYEGQDSAQVRQLCEYLLHTLGLPWDNVLFERALATYTKALDAFHPREAITEEQIRVWQDRFQKLVDEKRQDEIPSTRLRMYTSLANPFTPVDPGIHEMLSRLLLDQGDYIGTIQEIDYALRLLKDDTDLLYRKALAAVELQNLQQAEQIIQHLFSLNTKLQADPEIASLAGRIFRERWILTHNPDLLDNAIAAYKRAYEANPANYYPGINAAELLLAKGETTPAEEIFKRILAMHLQSANQQNASYWLDFTFGAIYLGLGNVPDALSAYQRGFQRNPSPSFRDKNSAQKGARRMMEAKKLPLEVYQQIDLLFT